ncbi:MAG: hypothetical protein QOE10_3026 [Gaiellales bacterium]|jgi:hypothetical protein|nr:hypothetical protein [Gaiellales bacterium]
MLPLSLYARARTHFSIAHETAGAARTRHSLRPPVFEGGPYQSLGRVAPRDREVMSSMKRNAFMKICSGGRP